MTTKKPGHEVAIGSRRDPQAVVDILTKAMNDCDEVVRKAHEATKDLKQACKEGYELLSSKLSKDIFTDEVLTRLERTSAAIDRAMEMKLTIAMDELKDTITPVSNSMESADNAFKRLQKRLQEAESHLDQISDQLIDLDQQVVRTRSTATKTAKLMDAIKEGRVRFSLSMENLEEGDDGSTD